MVRPRSLIRALLVAIVLALGACASAPTPATPSDPDPEIWRPKKPTYPTPDA